MADFAEPARTRHLSVITVITVLVVGCLLGVVAVPTPASADPPLGGGNGWTNYPNPDANKRNLGEIAPSAGLSTIANINASFNNARRVENSDICPGGNCEPNGRQMPINFALPANYASLSPSQKVLAILNQERSARGLTPFEGINADLQAVAQNWAQRMANTNDFSHNQNVLGQLAARCGNACNGQLGFNAAENLYGTCCSPGSGYPIAEAMYIWMYQDRNLGGAYGDQRWGHRHALLWTPLSDNHGPAGSEGFIGVGLASNANWTYVVWNAVDTGSAWPAYTPPETGVEGGFVPVTPCAILDTRYGSAYGFRALGNSTLTTQVTGSVPTSQINESCAQSGIVPTNATAVMVNVVAVGPAVTGNLRVSASGTTANGGVVNFGPGTNGPGTNANAVPVDLSAQGRIDVRVNAAAGVGATHVRLVVLGYYIDPSTNGVLGFVPINPCSVLDTRNGSSYGQPVGGGTTLRAQVRGSVPATQTNASCASAAPVPAGATAVMVNVIAVEPSATGNLRISAAGTTATGGVVNFGPGNNGAGTNSNAVPVALSGNGAVDVYVNSTGNRATHVRLVVVGYYVAPSAANTNLTPIAPCAIFDTRYGGAYGAAARGQNRLSVQATGPIGSSQTNESCAFGGAIPAGATGVMVNVVAVAPQTGGNLRISAAGTTANGGVVNFGPGNNGPGTNSNAVPVALSAAGALDVFVNAPGGLPATHVRLVVLGYYS